MQIHKQSERGQAIFLIAFALVALLGISSLAMDGGRVYADRRKAQNTADTSAFAGALVIAQSLTSDPTNLTGAVKTAAIAAAQARAASNAYDNADAMVTVSVEIPNVPLTDNGIYYLVTVTITSEIETTFAHLVYDGQLANTVYAIAKARPPQNIGFGFAVYGASKTNCKTIWFSGNNNTNIHGGGVFSNSSASAANCNSGTSSGGVNVNVVGGDVTTVGSFKQTGGGSISPAPVTGAVQATLPELPIPNCAGLVNYGNMTFSGSGTTTINPGIYGDISVGASHDLVMNPGMYCIRGTTGFKGNGGSVDGDGVMIYMQDGDFDLGGNAVVKLFAPTDLVDPSGNQWAGMLIYMPYDNDGQVVLTGSSGTKYRGTVYAPGPVTPDTRQKCVVSGTAGAISVESQLICYTIHFTGNANINMKYNSSQNYSFPASLGLQE